MLSEFQLAGRGFATLMLVVIALNVATPQARSHGDLHERIQALTQQIQTNPTNAELRLQRGDLRRQHGDFSSATADAIVAARLKPDWPAAMLERARIYSDTGQFAAAVASATDCLRLDGDNPDALVIRARCRVQLGQPAEAVADYNAVLSPTNGPRPLPDLYLERARAQTALGRFAAAVRGLDDGLARLGQTPSLALPALEYERASGDFVAALKRVERMRKFLTPENFHALRAEILWQSNRRAEAQKDFLAGLTVIENYPPARRARPPTRELEARLRAGLQEVDLPPAIETNTPYAK
jgi:tetratricopeptide (TPR) repeat protein